MSIGLSPGKRSMAYKNEKRDRPWKMENGHLFPSRPSSPPFQVFSFSLRSVHFIMISVDEIGEEKTRDLRRVLSTILSSTLVETVFGQVIDGLPVTTAYIYETTFRLDVENRDRPSDQSVSTFRNLRDTRLETELQSLSIGTEVGTSSPLPVTSKLTVRCLFS